MLIEPIVRFENSFGKFCLSKFLLISQYLSTCISLDAYDYCYVILDFSAWLNHDRIPRSLVVLKVSMVHVLALCVLYQIDLKNDDFTRVDKGYHWVHPIDFQMKISIFV